MRIIIRNTEICLLPERAIYLPKHKMLVLADVHLGKLAHFRRNGVFAPLPRHNPDLLLMHSLMEKHRPDTVVFLGDLFHSELNSGFYELTKMIEGYRQVRFILTRGNHDIISPSLLADCSIEVVADIMLEEGICLCHQLPHELDEALYYIIGHVHPGFTLQGGARQRYRLPCFHQQERVLVLPAFGRHTGLYMSKVGAGHRVYVVMGEEVLGV